MGHEVAAAAQRIGNAFRHRGVDLVDIELVIGLGREDAPQRFEIGALGRFVEGDTQVVGVDEAQVNA